MTTVNDTGAHPRSLEEILAEFQARISADFGEDFVISPATPQGQIAGIWALSHAVLSEALVAISNATSVNHSNGPQLDALGSLLDITRRPAVRSRVTATVRGVTGTGLPAGSRAATTDGVEFETLVDVVISESGTPVEMRATADGPLEAAAGTLTEIRTILAGWESVTNPSAAVVGRSRQNDASYKADYMVRTAHTSIGPMSALAGALNEALGGKTLIRENNSASAMVVQDYTISPHSIFVVAESGADADVRRAVENHRGMGVGTTVAIIGGPPNNSGLDAVTAGTLTWNDVDYSGLDLSAAATGTAKAAALTTLLDGVTVSYIGDRYVAIFNWMPLADPEFVDGMTGTVATLFGLTRAVATYPTGPFIRSVTQPLTVSMTLARQAGFPANGLDQARTVTLARIAEYGIGEQLWSNDVLCEVERIPGTRVTNLVIQDSDAVDVSAQAVPLHNLWSLELAGLTITVV